MQQSLQIGKTQWIQIQEPNKEIINQLAQEYGFHEVIVDDLIEINLKRIKLLEAKMDGGALKLLTIQEEGQRQKSV